MGRNRLAALAASLTLIVPTLCLAQTSWVRYDLTGVDKARAVVATSDCGLLVAGHVDSAFGFYNDAWLVRTNARGDVLWQQRVSTGGGDDVPYAALETPDGGFVVAGSTRADTTTQDFDFWVVKLDRDGDVEWQRAYGGPEWDAASGVAAAGDGGYVLVGRTESSGAGNIDLWVLRIDAAGGVLWQRTFGGDNHDWAETVVATPDGGFLVGGRTASQGLFRYDAWLVRLDGAGDVLWQRRHDWGGPSVAAAVDVTADGGFVVAEQIEIDDTDLALVKLDAAGDAEWWRVYGDLGGQASADLPVGVRQTGDGGYLVGAGVARGNNYDSHVLRLDAAGDVVWQRGHGALQDSQAFAMDVFSDDSFVLAGYRGDVVGEADFLVLKAGPGPEGSNLCPLNRNVAMEAITATPLQAETALVALASDVAPRTPGLSVVATAVPLVVGCRQLPAEVSPAGAAEPLRFSDAATLVWEGPDESTSESFNLYRGELGELAGGSSGSCLQSLLTLSTTTDPAVPAPDTGWFYVVTGSNLFGEGPSGCGCCGAWRDNAAPCP